MYRGCSAFSRFVSFGLRINTRQSSGLVEAFAVSKCPDQAWEEYETMKQRGQKLDQDAYDALISALARVGSSDRMFTIINEMHQRDMNASNDSYTSVIECCTRCGDVDKAFFLTRTLHNKSFMFSERLIQACRSFPALHTKLVCHDILYKE